MIVGEPLGLIALAGLPAVLALHLWRRRHPPRDVTALFLYPQAQRSLAAGRRRAPLVWRSSLWCELLAVLALAWWLADVHWSPRQAARHLVIVLDDRWRLSAGTDVRLRSRLAQQLATLQRDDRVTLVASGAPPRLLAGPAAERDPAQAALAAWRPQGVWHDLDAAISLAAGLAGPGAAVIVASDRVPAALPAGMGLVTAGQPISTSGLADVRWWRDANERLAVTLHAATPCQRNLSLSADSVVLATQRVDLPGTASVSLPAGLPDDAVLRLALDGDDALPIDDAVDLVRPQPRDVRVRVDLPDAVAIERALVAARAQVVTTNEHLLVTNPGSDRDWSITIGGDGGAPTLGPFLARRDHPVTADLDGTGALWSGGAERATGVPLLVADGRILISADARRVRLHLDLATSTVARHPLWPGLFANLVAWRRQHLPGPSHTNPRCGQPFTATLERGSGATLVAPDGSSRSLMADALGSIAIPGLPQPGLWRLTAGERTWTISALPLDARQADFAGATTSERTADLGGSQIARNRSVWAHLLPLLIAALAGIGAWLAFRREESA